VKENIIIGRAFDNIFLRIGKVDLRKAGLTVDSINCLEKYIKEYSYYKCIYSGLFNRAINKLRKPVDESTFVDYGGGTGILSLLALEAGFKTVIYIDIHESSVTDSRIISEIADLHADYKICGDIHDLKNIIESKDINPDIICSMDVLEHIYDLDIWISTLAGIKKKFSVLFMTGANARNPYIAAGIRKLHFVAEYRGCERNIRKGDVYIDCSNLEEREKIIKAGFAVLDSKLISWLAKMTRGLRKVDIEQSVKNYLVTGHIELKEHLSTNTCDPYTGSWTERLIEPSYLKNIAERYGMKISFSNSLYCYSGRKMLNVGKFLMNIILRIAGRGNLFFSPSLIVGIEKTDS